MGNMWSSIWNTNTNSNSQNNQIDILQKRLTNLEDLDTNRDGIVTKDEFDTWVKKQQLNLEQFRESVIQETVSQYQDKLKTTQDKIQELTKQNEALQSINRSLEQDLKKQLVQETIRGNGNGHGNGHGNPASLSILSKERINQFVEELLNDKDINISMMPDFMEKQLYRNIFRMFISIIDKLFETTSIQFIGHQITLKLDPVLEKDLTQPISTESDHSDRSDHSDHKKSNSKTSKKGKR